MADEVPRVRLTDWRGINQEQPPDQLSPQELVDAVNVFLTRGTIKVRGGRSKLTATEIAGSNAIRGLHRFYRRKAGNTHETQDLVVSGTDLWYRTTGVFAGAGDTFTGSNRFTMATMKNAVYIGDGVNTMRKWDGAAISTLSGITAPSAPGLKQEFTLIDCTDNAITPILGWSTTDAVNFTLSEETTLRWRGTVSVKAAATANNAVNDYIECDLSTATGAVVDLSDTRYISFWVRSDRTGSFMQFGFGETAGNDYEWAFDIPQANQWIEVTVRIDDMPRSVRNAVDKIRFTCLNDDVSFNFYVDHVTYSGGLYGTYLYRTTYYNSTSGVESPPSDDVEIDVSGTYRNTVRVSFSASGAADKLRIYRLGGASSVWRLVVEVADTSTEYYDKLPSSELGAIQDPWNGAPPLAKYIVPWNNRLCCAGNPAAPSRLYLSNYDDPEQFPDLTLLSVQGSAGGYFDVQADDGDVITGLAPFGDYLLIFKSHSVWLLEGTTFRDFNLRQVTNEIGCAAHQSIASYQRTVLWFTGENLAMYQSGGTISLVGDEVETLLSGVTQSNRSLVAAAVHDYKYFLFYCSGAVAYNDLCLVYDMRRSGWVRLTGWNVSEAISTVTPNDSDGLYCGDAQDGFVWDSDIGTTDAGTAISWEVTSPHIVFGEPTRLKAIREYDIFFEPANEFVHVQVDADGSLQRWERTHNLAPKAGGREARTQGSVRHRPPRRVNGRYLQVSLSGAADAALELHRVELQPEML